MAFIQMVQPKDAEGVIKEGYDMFEKHVGIIPKPMEMLSASPVLFELGLKRIQYFSAHPTLSFPLLAHIRYLAAHSLDFGFCMDFNKALLEKQGVGEDDFQRMEKDPSKSLLEEKDSAMLAFVIHAMRSPGSVTEKDIESLKALGWEEQDMVDALAQGVSMIDHSIMMQTFRIDNQCMTP